MSDLGIWIIAIVFVFVLLSVAVFIYSRFIRTKNRKSYDHNIYLVSIPRYSDLSDNKQEQSNTIKIRLTQVENLFAIMSSVKAERSISALFRGRKDHFALEMVVHQGLIRFYAILPKKMSDFFIQQVQSVYPHAHFQPVVDYNMFQPQAAILGGYLKFRRGYMFPIKTYATFEDDPLEGLTSALSKLPRDSGAAIQYVIRSAKKSWHKTGRQVVQQAYKTGSLKKAVKSYGPSTHGLSMATKVIGSIFSVLGASMKKTEEKEEQKMIPEKDQLSQMDQEAIKGIEEKTSKGGLDLNIRIVVSAPDQQRAETYMKNIMNSFGQYNVYEYGNAFKPSYVGSRESLIQDFIYRYYEPRARVVVNAEEMTSLFHLPEDIDTPNIKWLNARSSPPPSELPQQGILLGHSTYRGETVDIRIKDEDRRRHVYIIGQTGTGKTVLMEHMAIQDIERHRGVCVIDPHGDLIEKILGYIPPERMNDVIIFDPADTDRPLALNMLEFSQPEQKGFVINEMINIFDKLYDLRQTGGPMFEQYMRNTMLLMMEDPDSGSTLLEVPKVLSDEKFRRYKLSKTKNPVVKDFWEKEAQKAGGEAALANMVPYITSKLTQFVANDIMRPIIAQQKSSFDFRKVMDEQKILLINLSKGKIGDMNSALLGMVCVGKLLMAALSRVDVPETERKDFYLYIDEFQNYITDSIAIILSEARKYKLNLTIAHQYINQLIRNTDTSVRDAVFGNVGTIAAYRVGVEDSEMIAQQFSPVVDKFDVMNIAKYNAYLRLLIDNHNPPAFNFTSEYHPPRDPQLAMKLKELSRSRYGRPRNVIEKEILERSGIATQQPNPLPPIR